MNEKNNLFYPALRATDQRNDSAEESTLHECARRGDAASVQLLVACGADLALQNHHGNTVTHILVEESIRGALSREGALRVFRAIAACATRWWCMKHDLQA